MQHTRQRQKAQRPKRRDRQIHQHAKRKISSKDRTSNTNRSTSQSMMTIRPGRLARADRSSSPCRLRADADADLPPVHVHPLQSSAGRSNRRTVLDARPRPRGTVTCRQEAGYAPPGRTLRSLGLPRHGRQSPSTAVRSFRPRTAPLTCRPGPRERARRIPQPDLFCHFLTAPSGACRP